MILLQQLKLSIEESHSDNDGNAQGGGEKHFVEHLFLLVSALGLGQIVSTCSSCYKPEWSENRPARPAGVDPLHCSRFQRKSTSKPAGKGPGVNPLHCSRSRRFIPLKPPGKGPRGKSIAAQSVSAIYTLKPPGHDLPLRQLNQSLKQNAL